MEDPTQVSSDSFTSEKDVQKQRSLVGSAPLRGQSSAGLCYAREVFLGRQTLFLGDKMEKQDAADNIVVAPRGSPMEHEEEGVKCSLREMMAVHRRSSGAATHWC